MIELEYVKTHANLTVSAIIDYDGLTINYFLNADASEECWMETDTGTVRLSPTPEEMQQVRAVVHGRKGAH